MIMMKVLVFLQGILRRFGYRLQKLPPSDSNGTFERLHARVRTCTMTSRDRQQALFDAVTYIEENGIEGSIVECGVWKGGSSMLAALTLLERGSTDRALYLYDTYAGYEVEGWSRVAFEFAGRQGAGPPGD